ncbi:hypothetical protein GIB67_041885 [Kingdonia uniflora]|uniref:protein-serine/threonine phosphatase n=1 Tax=Kingdonia uniflora TaxID=39325 RepID=A0A7J7L600_9MAGN|nr:hypothetical protein GIB67_041885 [Kingdonia uniflora]
MADYLLSYPYYSSSNLQNFEIGRYDYNYDYSNSNSNNSRSLNSMKKLCDVVIEELEEGEIRIEEESPVNIHVLETVKSEEKSFDGVCLQIWKSLETLKNMVLENNVALLEVFTLIQKTFAVIKVVNYDFRSMTPNQQGRKKDVISRLITYVKGEHYSVFSPQQMKEIDAMMCFLDLRSSVKSVDKENAVGVINAIDQNELRLLNKNQTCHGLKRKLNSETMPVKLMDQIDANMEPESLSSESVSARKRNRIYSPLFDVHSGLDADSLPSPTRQGLQILPMQKGYETEYVTSHPRSFLLSNRLPNPTLLLEYEDADNCSSSSVSHGSIVNSALPVQPFVNQTGRNASALKSVVLNNRVPWLRFANSVAAGDLRTSSNSEVGMEICDLKTSNSGEVGMDKDLSSSYNFSTDANQQLPVSITDTAATLFSLIKDNPTNQEMLIRLIMEHQKLVADHQQTSVQSSQNATSSSSSSFVMGNTPLINEAPLKTSNIEHSVAHNLQVSSQTTNMEGSRTIHMKPRDPRHVLHNNTNQENGFSETGHLRASRTLMSITHGNKDNLIVKVQDRQAQTSLPFPSASTPDISQEFTKSLLNLSDIFSAPQTIHRPSTVTETTSSQEIPVMTYKKDMNTVTAEPNETPSEGAPGSSQSQTTWKNVEHLFQEYNDKERATIHIERAKRIEEQNKMFATKKLSLVLDLDHTLLNSAKFDEVDPVHYEILRKKAVIDLTKPKRHLFHFQRMGMWTKLRPGVWNFLEKASKLFELHLYTMGNKRYATEIAKVLDPTGNLFAGRIIAKGDDMDTLDGDEMVPKFKDLDGVMGMESSVVIIDDTIKVWPHNKLNLIAVDRFVMSLRHYLLLYHYFPCSRRHYGLSGPSLLEIDHDESLSNGTLAASLAVIERIHSNFFSQGSLNDFDVRTVLESEQRKILAGCHLLFSRIIPVGETKPHLHPLWQTAEQFGAVCTNQIDDNVTHVVSNSLGTDKVLLCFPFYSNPLPLPLSPYNFSFLERKYVICCAQLMTPQRLIGLCLLENMLSDLAGEKSACFRIELAIFY